MAAPIQLRCPRTMHGIVHDGTPAPVLAVKCHQCTRRAGHPVYHAWDTKTWRPIDPVEGAAADHQGGEPPWIHPMR